MALASKVEGELEKIKKAAVAFAPSGAVPAGCVVLVDLVADVEPFVSVAPLRHALSRVALADRTTSWERWAAYVTRRMPSQPHALVVALYGGVTARWVPRLATLALLADPATHKHVGQPWAVAEVLGAPRIASEV